MHTEREKKQEKEAEKKSVRAKRIEKEQNTINLFITVFPLVVKPTDRTCNERLR
jgi:hypothetical protein